MKKIFAFLMLLALGATMLACGSEKPGNAEKSNTQQGSESQAQSGEPAGDKKVTLGFVHQTLNNPNFVHMNDVMKEEAQKLGVELILLDSQDDVSKEMSNVEDLISRKVDVIGVTACDAEGTEAAIKAAKAAGFPVINVDRFVANAGADTKIGSDNVEGGRMLCEKIAEDAGGKEVKLVLLRGKMGATTDTERNEGFKEELKKHPNIEIVSEQSGYFDRTKGFEAMENILQAQSEVEYICAFSDEMAIGAYQAVEAASRQDEGIKIVGYDGEPDAMECIDDGRLWALGFQDFDTIGRKIIRDAVTLANGGSVEEEQRLPVIWCTKENYDELAY